MARLRLLALWLFCGMLGACGEPSLRLGATTTQQDSGLLQVLSDAFYKAHGITIKPIIAGSGQLFRLIERGDVDIAISHEPEGEQRLLEQGVIYERTPLFYNYFVLVGHTRNPANINPTMSMTEVFQALLKSRSRFVSRDDHSGTHKAEQQVWHMLHQQPTADRWIKTGTGMGHTLNVTREREAYTLADWGTWLQFNKQDTLQLLWQPPELTQALKDQVTDSKHRLYNSYSLLSIHDTASQTEAVRLFKTWMLTEGKTVIERMRIDQQRAFFMAP